MKNLSTKKKKQKHNESQAKYISLNYEKCNEASKKSMTK